ncbi:MAG TPA: hypothetical protein VLW54_01835 [Candidatus Acidoferrales bacterium]|nr:hypothetical protein [Candidatus Acidoferrales bacterium]
MKHFEAEEWIDFVNDTLTSGRREEMQRHLDAPCLRCGAMVSLWHRVRKAGQVERSYQPPDGAVRALKAAFEASGRRAGRKRVGSVIQTLFDSFLQPAPSGARSARGRVRQVLYRAEPYQIDVQIETTPSGARLLITGQVLDVTHAETVARRIPVVLSNGKGSVVRTFTNEHGEFEGVVEDSGDVELSFVGNNYQPTVITLRDALGRRPGGAQ